MDSKSTEKQIPLAKVIYFDEGSATDFIQIFNDGKLESVAELIDSDRTEGEAGVRAQVGIRTKLLKYLAGLDAKAEANGTLSTSFNSGTIVKSIVTNTVLTDFIHAVKDDNTDAVRIFEKYSIEQISGSISSIALLTPYFSMLRGGQGISAGDFDISLDKLDPTLSKAKGYFEFLGVDKCGSAKCIFRFNSNAFKNNYRPTDLLKMDLMLYAVKVGSCTLDELAADNELNIEGFTAKDNPDYESDTQADECADNAILLDMYDVVLAGVTVDGK